MVSGVIRMLYSVLSVVVSVKVNCFVCVVLMLMSCVFSWFIVVVCSVLFDIVWLK